MGIGFTYIKTVSFPFPLPSLYVKRYVKKIERRVVKRWKVIDCRFTAPPLPGALRKVKYGLIAR